MIWEDEIDEDEERHRPLLDLGIPMDFKAHGVDNFKAQLEELERGVLMLNHLGKSPPQSPSKLRRRKETMIRNKKKRESKIEKVAESSPSSPPSSSSSSSSPSSSSSSSPATLHSNKQQSASSVISMLDRQNSKKKKSVIVKSPSSPSSPTRVSRVRAEESLNVNVNDDAAFEKFLKQAQLDSRYCLDDKDVLEKKRDEVIKDGKESGIIIDQDEMLMWSQGVMGKREMTRRR